MSDSKAKIRGNTAIFRLRCAELFGANIEKVLRELSLSRREVEDIDNYQDQSFDNNVWRVIEQETADSLIGLTMSKHFQLSTLGLVGRAIMACETVSQGVASYVRYTQMTEHLKGVTLSKKDGDIVVNVETLPANLTYLRHTTSFHIGAIKNSFNQLSGYNFPLKEVGFNFSATNEEERRFQDVLNAKVVHFNQDKNWFTIDSVHKNLPNLSANLSIFKEVDKQIVDRYQSENNSIVSQVGTYIKMYLGSSDISLLTISQGPGMSERKLQGLL